MEKRTRYFVLGTVAVGVLAFGLGSAVNDAYQAVNWAHNPTQESPIDNVKPATPLDGCTDDFILRVNADIRARPDEWSQESGFWMETGGGWFGRNYMAIWVANEDYGLDFALKDSFVKSDIDYPFSDECKAVLWNTISKWKVYHYKKKFQ